MSTPVFRALQPGLHTTIQDRGRFGYRHLGVPVSGPMDSFAFEVANCLVGNPRNTPTLEISAGGAKLLAECDMVIAICGGNFGPTIYQLPVPLWKTTSICKGQTLAFGTSATGLFTYISIAGGFDASRVMNSASTYTRGQFGGSNGRKLAAGDVLLGNPHMHTPAGRSLSPLALPDFAANEPVRVIPGPQDDLFPSAAHHTLFTSTYVFAGGDRMGYRLQGPPLAASSKEILTDAVAPGAIQVPSDGQPIVLLTDGPTCGGYPKIATVISVDLGRVAQLLPRQNIRFRPVSVEEAQGALCAQEDFLQKLETSLRVVAN